MIKIAVISSGRYTSFCNSLTLIPRICPNIHLQVFAPYYNPKLEEINSLGSQTYYCIKKKPSPEEYESIANTIDPLTSAVLVYSKCLIPGCIFNRYISVNFHPSVLPDYPGLNGLQEALSHHHLGFTAHVIDGSVDLGPRLITCEIKPFPLSDNSNLVNLSFMMCSIISAHIIAKLSSQGLNIHSYKHYHAISVEILEWLMT